MKITNLKQAQADPKAMNKFIKEHKGDHIESTDFDKVIRSMVPKRGAIQNVASPSDSKKFSEGDA